MYYIYVYMYYIYYIYIYGFVFRSLTLPMVWVPRYHLAPRYLSASLSYTGDLLHIFPQQYLGTTYQVITYAA